MTEGYSVLAGSNHEQIQPDPILQSEPAPPQLPPCHEASSAGDTKGVRNENRPAPNPLGISRRPNGTVVVPFYGRDLPEPMRAVNRSHAKIRTVGERAIATIKTWRLLAKLHCCPRRATPLLAAILVLQLVEEQRYSG